MEPLRSNHRKSSVKTNILSKYRVVNTGTTRTQAEMSAIFSVSLFSVSSVFLDRELFVETK